MVAKRLETDFAHSHSFHYSPSGQHQAQGILPIDHRIAIMTRANHGSWRSNFIIAGLFVERRILKQPQPDIEK